MARRWLIMMGLVLVGGFSTPTANESVQVNNRWTISGEYTLSGLALVDEQITAWLRDFTVAALQDASSAANPAVPEAEWSLLISDELQQPLPAVVSIRYDMMTNHFGAAHPATRIHTLNIATADGRVLSLDDLFSDASSALAIFSTNAPHLLAEEFVRRSPSEYPAGFDAEWIEDGFIARPENYQAFLVEEDGLRLFFQQYQVLAYSYGSPSVVIPLSLLTGAGPNPDIWPNTGPADEETRDDRKE